MIDLDRVKKILTEDVFELLDGLDKFDLDETGAIEGQTKSKARTLRAEKSKELLLLADRLELAANLVRNEYWYARGEVDPLDPERDA